MRTFALPLLALALSGCVASHEQMRELQTPRAAPHATILFPVEHELRDAVVLEWIGGVSQHSYVLAEPNQSVLRPLIMNALNNSGLQAGTPVRARYGLRVLVDDANGPDFGTDMTATLNATYVIVERSSGREIFRHTVATNGLASFLPLNEGDLHRATQHSASILRAISVAGFNIAAVDALYDAAPGAYPADYSEWTQADWNEFWRLYSYSSLAALVIPPALVGLEMANPLNYTPFASDHEIADAARGDSINRAHQAREDRDGLSRAARANYRASAANVTTFLVALTAQEGVKPIPILPCWGSPAVEELKHAIMTRGAGNYRTDNCMIRR